MIELEYVQIKILPLWLLKLGWGVENLSFGEKDCQNFIEKARNFIEKAREFRLGKGSTQALRDYFNRMEK